MAIDRKTFNSKVSIPMEDLVNLLKWLSLMQEHEEIESIDADLDKIDIYLIDKEYI